MGQREGIGVSGVVFDCDGTLMDTMGLWLSMEDELAERMGRRLTPAERGHLRSLTVAETGAYLHDELGVFDSAQAVVDEIGRMAYGYYANSCELRPGALEFVQALAAAGVPCAIASSSPRAFLEAGVAHTGLAGLLCAVVSTDDVGASKRESAVYDRARELIGADLSTTWVCEDAAYTFAATKAAGYHTLGIYDRDDSGTFEELSTLADVAIRSWGELDVARFLAGGYARTSS